MTAKIDFFYDLVSPNTYMANQVLPGVAKRHNAEINYIPCLLGGVMKATNNQPPFIVFANVKPKMAYGAVEMDRFVRKHDLSKYKMNPHFPFNSLPVMRTAVAAEMEGKLVEFIKAGEELIWEEGTDVGDADAFAAGLTRKGFDGPALLEKTQDPAVKAKLVENTELAIERGLFGVPTFFVGDEMFFGKDRILDLEEEIVAQS